MHAAMHRHAARRQFRGIGFAFIAEWIELAGMDKGGRQARQIIGQQRRQARIAAVGAGAVKLQVTLQCLPVQEIAIGQFKAGDVKTIGLFAFYETDGDRFTRIRLSFWPEGRL